MPLFATLAAATDAVAACDDDSDGDGDGNDDNEDAAGGKPAAAPLLLLPRKAPGTRSELPL